MHSGDFRWVRICALAFGAAVVLTKATIAQDNYSNLANAVLWSRTAHDGSTRVIVKLGPTVLSIPDNYIFTPPYQDAPPRDATAPPDRVSFDILVSIDGFKPRSKENMPDFPEPGIGKKLRIGVSYNHVDTAYWKSHTAAVDHLTSRDLKFREEIGMHYYVALYEGEVLFEGPPDAPKERVVCGEPWPDGYPKDKRERACTRTVDAGNNVTINWYYNRDYLPQRKAIDKMVMDGLNQFRTSGPPLEISE